MEGEELLWLRGCPTFPVSVSVPVLVLGVGLESDGAVLLSPPCSLLDGKSEKVAKEKPWLECSWVCAAICSLSRCTMRVAPHCHQIGLLQPPVGSGQVHPA